MSDPREGLRSDPRDSQYFQDLVRFKKEKNWKEQLKKNKKK
jgi:hypothetical protein